MLDIRLSLVVVLESNKERQVMSDTTNTNLIEEAYSILEEGYLNKYDTNKLELALGANDLNTVFEVVQEYRLNCYREEVLSGREEF